MTDPVEDGAAWAQRQQAAFPQWVTRYGGDDSDLWDFGLDSLDRLTYIVFDQFPTPELIDDPSNAGFSDPAAWYLGEIVCRSDPKKRRWKRCDHGFDAGDYIVEPVAKTHKWWVNPRGHLRYLGAGGDPLWLRAHYIQHIAPLWDKPWPAWIHSSETGSWWWDEAANRWWSQRDQWINSIAGLLAVFSERHPGIVLDYSTASLHAVEALVVNDRACDDPVIRDAVVAYVGECLLRADGGKWIWDVHPAHLTTGFPVVLRSITRVSPAHLIDYALARRDGQTFTRIHRAWIAEAEDDRNRNPGYVRDRELTPGLDPIREPVHTVAQWAQLKRTQFADWVRGYGGGRRWDFTADSLGGLAELLLEHCAPGTDVLDADDDFIDGAVWYFGETLHRAIPSRWSFTADNAERTKEGRHGLTISINPLREVYVVGYPMAVFLVQELDMVVRPRAYTGPDQPETDPHGLRRTYELWATSAIRHRIEESQKRREAVKRRAGRRLSDETVLERWLAEREDHYPQWMQQFGVGLQWDFGVDSLDTLEELIKQVAAGPEELLEDKANADFLDGAAWYLGEVLRRAAPDRTHWCYDRNYLPEPFLSGWYHVAEQLATVYAKNGGALRRWYENVLRIKMRVKETEYVPPST